MLQDRHQQLIRKFLWCFEVWRCLGNVPDWVCRTFLYVEVESLPTIFWNYSSLTSPNARFPLPVHHLSRPVRLFVGKNTLSSLFKTPSTKASSNSLIIENCCIRIPGHQLHITFLSPTLLEIMIHCVNAICHCIACWDFSSKRPVLVGSRYLWEGGKCVPTTNGA